MSETVLEVENLRKVFTVKSGFLKPVTLAIQAVDRVSFKVRKGEAFGLVGESGCGKSTVGRCILGLVDPTSGVIRFRGEDVGGGDRRRMLLLKQRIQIIFQDPYSSLNPRRTIGRTLAEPLIVHKRGTRLAIKERVADILDQIGLDLDAVYKYPYEFSGGQRQRIAIARALILGPELIVADEPVSSLDVSIQSQILLLLRRLKEVHNLSFVFISHDLGVIRYFCQRLAVMYLGRIVEQGRIPELFEAPLHPYTRMLRDASPIPDPARKVGFSRMEGEIGSAAEPPDGCHFHPRCSECMPICRRQVPSWTSVGKDRGVACHLYEGSLR